MSMRLRLVPLFLAVIILTIFSILLTEYSESEKKTMLGSPLPSLTVTPYNDDTPLLQEAIDSAPLKLVNMFASWCVPCIAELPVLATLKKQGGIPIYGILWRDDIAHASKWLETHQHPYTHIWVDKRGNSGVELGIHGIPESFLIDENNTIIWHITGPITKDILHNDLLPTIHATQK